MNRKYDEVYCLSINIGGTSLSNTEQISETNLRTPPVALESKDLFKKYLSLASAKRGVRRGSLASFC